MVLEEREADAIAPTRDDEHRRVAHHEDERLEHTCIVKCNDISGVGGGGELEQPRQRLGAQWVGRFLGVTSCPEPPGAP